MEAPDVLGDLMATIRDLVAAALTDHDRPVSRVLIAAGANPAWDECCEGMLYIRLVTSFPSGNPFPQIDTRPSSCKPTMMASQIGIAVLRCASTEDTTAKTLNEEGAEVVLDSSIVLEAIRCDIAALLDDQSSNLSQMVIGTWNPLGPDGGCVGGEWLLTLGHGNCACPEG